MPSRHLSLRLPSETIDRLDRQSRLTGQNRSEVAKTLLEEGLRMEAHPGIVFRPGPAGRRPGLSDGPDVWEVARVLREVLTDEPDPVAATAELTELRPDQIRTVLGYYAEYRTEIDDWIQRVDDYADAAEAAWRREQALLAR